MQPSSLIESEMRAVYEMYAAMTAELRPEFGLGGKLLYAGELDEQGTRLVRAANIAGAASLSASSDPEWQRRAVREGIVDFLVTSLDEALRILKNEIRKRQAASVCVGLQPEQVLAEMCARGVLPDLLAPCDARPELDTLIAQGARRLIVQPLGADSVFIVCRQPGAEFEAAALETIPESDSAARRWLRLAPRYLGPQARRHRSLPCDHATAARLRARFGADSVAEIG